MLSGDSVKDRRFRFFEVSFDFVIGDISHFDGISE